MESVKRKVRTYVKTRFKRVVSMVVAVALILTLIPVTYFKKVGAAEDGKAKFSVLNASGTIDIGRKQETGNWLKISVGRSNAFCLDLGKACHNGDEYKTDGEVTYRSSSNNLKESIKARICYWYYHTRNKSDKAYMYAQSLLWAVEEGIAVNDNGNIVKARLTKIISQVMSASNYLSKTGVEDLYTEIMNPGKDVTAKVKVWMPQGATKAKQKLLAITGTNEYEDIPEWEANFYNATKEYQQSITVKKVDDEGNPVPGITFRLIVENIKEKISGMSSPNGQSGDFNEYSATTDANGNAVFTFTYRIQSRDYYYIDDANWKIISDNKLEGDVKTRFEENDWMSGTGANDGQRVSYTYAAAKSAAETELRIHAMQVNHYILTEIQDDRFIPNEYTDGEDIEVSADETKEVEVVNEWKKVSLRVQKKDGFSGDGLPRGDSTLGAALYGLYSDEACTNLLGQYQTDANGYFVTEPVKVDTNYYLKEITPSYGYKLNPKVYPVNEDGAQYTERISPSKDIHFVDEEPYLGRVSLQKVIADGTGEAKYEVNAKFRVYLKSKGSYENCSAEERAELITDKTGYAISNYLYVGKYIIEQIDTGGEDVEMIGPKEVDVPINETVDKEYNTVHSLFNDAPFKAYLKIIKKDGNTGKTVLKKDTAYEIYKIEDDGTEKKIVQSYSDGHKMVEVDQFSTDITGEIMTVKALKSGQYKIYEVNSATGLYIKDKFVEITINSKASNYEYTNDSEGNRHAVVTMEYVNYEARGRVTFDKTGEVLEGSDDKKLTFEKKDLKNVVFEVSAAEDIETQDGQNETWFKKGDVVATVTTGVGATFMNDCGGICTYTLDGNKVTIDLPLGKYMVKEIKTGYGYIIPDKTWNLEFKYADKDTPVVYDTESSNEKGELKINNELAKAKISIVKKDANSDKAVANTVFDFYAKNDVYAADGTLIYKADELITTVKTNEKGVATIDVEVPFMDENYKDNNDESLKLNSGDYYFVEKKISDSYYLDDKPIDVHVEYKDEKTPEINVTAVQKNTSTQVELGKAKLTNSEELSGCKMEIDDSNKNPILSWVSGTRDSAAILNKAYELDYENLSAQFNEKGNIVISGLKHDEEYTFIERQPEDGYTTAESIVFKLVKNEDENGNITTDVLIKGTDGSFSKADGNSVIMKDDTTKCLLSKITITGEAELPGCNVQIEDLNGNVIESWVTTDQPHLIEAKLGVNKLYKYVETRAADGYATAESITFTVLDTGEIQKVTMKDDTIKFSFNKTDITGKKELPGCKYVIKDKNGNVIDKWTTTKKPHKVVAKLVAGEEYTLTEIKAKAGYATAEKIKFKVKDTGEIQKINMKDKPIRIKFLKYSSKDNKLLAGSEWEVKNSNDKVVLRFKTSRRKAYMIEAKLKAGEKYTFTETKAPANHKKADSFTYEVKDTGKIQKIKVVDEYEKVPFIDLVKTGNDVAIIKLIAMFALSAACIVGIAVALFRKKKVE